MSMDREKLGALKESFWKEPATEPIDEKKHKHPKPAPAPAAPVVETKPADPVTPAAPAEVAPAPVAPEAAK